MAPHSSTLAGKSHGQRSLVGCGPWGHEESDMTERLPFHFSLSCIGEGNGNPLQCFCLENPRDGGAWWAAIYGVTQSRTRLKWLSSSSKKSVAIYSQERSHNEVANSKELLLTLKSISFTSSPSGIGWSQPGYFGQPFCSLDYSVYFKIATL